MTICYGEKRRITIYTVISCSFNYYLYMVVGWSADEVLDADDLTTVNCKT